MASSQILARNLASRTAAGLLGSYAFGWGFVSLGTVLAVAAGWPFHEAQGLTYMLVFLLVVATFCWAFAARRVSLVWAVLVGGGAVMTALAWFGSRALL